MYPNGTLVTYENTVYRISDSKLIELISWRAALSWNQPFVPLHSDLDFDKSSAKLGFRPTTMIKYAEQYYIIEANKRRLVASPDFWDLGFNKFEAIEVSKEELEFHKIGEDLV